MTSTKLPLFISVKVKGRKAYAGLHKKVLDDKKTIAELLHPENDFLYSQSDNLPYINKLAGKK